MRSSTVNIGDFDGLVVTPITSRSTNFAPRRIISIWPRVMGSNVPGYTPTRTFDSVISDLFQSHNLLSRAADRPRPHKCARSEEHTSELQSLMRISYAVFFL